MSDVEQRGEYLDCTTDPSTLQTGGDGVERVVADHSTSLKLSRSRSSKDASSYGYSG